jgi:ferric-dicitrate binding protein FerR (iron transport regulator)
VGFTERRASLYLSWGNEIEGSYFMLRVSKPWGVRRAGRPANIFRRARRAFALLAAAALLNAAGPARAAEPARRPTPSGQVALAAGLAVDGLPAVAGQTVFPGSSYDTAEESRGMVELANRTRLELSGGTALRLDFSDDSVGGTLGAGGARLSVPRSVAASFTTADASVVSDNAAPALFSLRVSAEGTTLTVQSGRVEMRAGGAARSAGAGESLRAAHGAQPAPPQGNGLSSRKRAGIFIGIAAAVAVVVLILAGRDNDEEFGQPCPLIVSPNGSNPPGCVPVIL